jgi:hypothetical protein
MFIMFIRHQFFVRLAAFIAVIGVVIYCLSRYVPGAIHERILHRQMAIAETVPRMVRDHLIVRPDDVQASMDFALRCHYELSLDRGRDGNDAKALLFSDAEGCIDAQGKMTPAKKAALIRAALPYLHSNEPIIRAYACALLEQIHDPSTKPYLLRATSDSDSLVRSVASNI